MIFHRLKDKGEGLDIQGSEREKILNPKHETRNKREFSKYK